MCVEEHDRLVENGSPSFKVFTQQGGVSARKQYAFVFTLAVCAAFAAGFFSTPSNNPLLFRSNSTSSSDNAVAYADRVNDWDDMANANHTTNNNWDGTSDNERSLPLFNASFVNYLTSGMKVMLARNNGTKLHYIYDSPYEKRWPGSKQPYWSRKTIPFNTHIESEKQICFVHVGKTGGSTVGCMLGFSLHCDSDNDIKGILPIVTTHALHRGINDCPEHAGYNLFVVRDPLARMLSTMNYERPNMTKPEPFSGRFHKKELYQDCDFWTLEDLARKGLRNTNYRDSLSNMCRERAYSAMTGVGKYLIHGYFNYQVSACFIGILFYPSINQSILRIFIQRYILWCDSTTHNFCSKPKITMMNRRFQKMPKF